MWLRVGEGDYETKVVLVFCFSVVSIPHATFFKSTLLLKWVESTQPLVAPPIGIIFLTHFN